MYVDKHALHVGQRNPNMETDCYHICEKQRQCCPGFLRYIFKTEEMFWKVQIQTMKSNIYHLVPPSFSILQRPNWIICIIQQLKAPQDSIWLYYPTQGTQSLSEVKAH